MQTSAAWMAERRLHPSERRAGCPERTSGDVARATPSRGTFCGGFLGLGRPKAAPRLPSCTPVAIRRAESRSASVWHWPSRRQAAAPWGGPSGSNRGRAERSSGGPYDSTPISKTTLPRRSCGCPSTTAPGRGILPSRCPKWSGRDGGRRCGDRPRCMITACQTAIRIAPPASRLETRPAAGNQPRPISQPAGCRLRPRRTASSGSRRCWLPPGSAAAAAARN